MVSQDLSGSCQFGLGDKTAGSPSKRCHIISLIDLSKSNDASLAARGRNPAPLPIPG
jgi:hypothetical protein